MMDISHGAYPQQSSGGIILANQKMMPHAPISNPPSQVGSVTTTQTAAEPILLFRQQRTSVGFLLNKAVELLKQQQGKQLHIKELERALIQSGFGNLHSFFLPNSDFMRALSNNSRVAVNPVHRTVCFINPYELITSPAALRTRIYFDGGVTGLRVDQELLAGAPSMADYVNTLLSERQVRCVRTTTTHLRGKFKCLRVATTGGGAPCDLYAAKRCVNCKANLLGLILYPLGEEEVEQARLTLDKDVKELWDQVTMPPLEDLVRQMSSMHAIPRLNGNFGNPENSTHVKRAGDAKKITRNRNKFRRIQNTHLFTPDQLRAFANGQPLE